MVGDLSGDKRWCEVVTDSRIGVANGEFRALELEQFGLKRD